MNMEDYGFGPEHMMDHLLHPNDGNEAQKIGLLVETLEEARLQIIYLQEMFSPTGSGNAVLARITHVLKEVEGKKNGNI